MNDFSKKLKEVSELLTTHQIDFAVAGGVVANIYREDIRTTLDLDFLFYTVTDVDKEAIRILEKLGLKAGLVKEHQLARTPGMNKKSKPNLIAVGRTGNKTQLGVDFLLPSFRWFSKALERAKDHLIDFGFAKLPAVTVEDMLIMKLDAGRNKDLDDIQSILKVSHQLDFNYLNSEIERISLFMPKEIKKLLKQKFKVSI